MRPERAGRNALALPIVSHGVRSLVWIPAAVLAVAMAACGATGPTSSAPAGAVIPSPAGSAGASGPALTPVPGTTAGPSLPPDLQPCRADALRIEVGGQGATGSVAIGIRVTNASDEPCAIAGAPADVSLRSGGGHLPVAYHADPWAMGDDTEAVAPAVVLAPGDSAYAVAVWSNWCDGPAPVDTAWITLPMAEEAVDTQPVMPLSAPRCDVEGAASTIEGFAFEPDADQ